MKIQVEVSVDWDYGIRSVVLASRMNREHGPESEPNFAVIFRSFLCYKEVLNSGIVKRNVCRTVEK